jgi:tryptophanase
MSSALVKKFCVLNLQSRELLEQAVRRLSLSPRGYFRIIKVARTIADLEGSEEIGIGNIGGFLTCKDSTLAETIRTLMVVTEGFPTYGGLAGRDLEALSIGLGEILDENYLKYRIRSTQYLGEGFRDAGFKMVEPFGGHAIYIDAALTCPEIPLHQFPGQSISVALYEYLGVRSVEVGSVMLGKYDVIQQKEIAAPKELVRLAIPRRVYTQSHVDYILEGARQMRSLLSELPGYRLTYQAPILRHFTAKFEPVQ